MIKRKSKALVAVVISLTMALSTGSVVFAAGSGGDNYGEDIFGPPETTVTEVTTKKTTEVTTKKDDTANTTTASQKKLDRAVIKSAKNVKGKKISLKIKKVSNASGYQVSYAKNRKFTKATKVSTSKLNITLKKLTKNKKYYVKVRAYITKDKKKTYGAWSKVKKIKINK